MFTDDPFTPETVDERVTDFIENRRDDNQMQPSNRNQNLIQNLQQLYSNQQINALMLEEAKKSVFQRLDQKTYQSNIATAMNTSQAIPQLKHSRKKVWRLNLLIAIIIVVFSLSAIVFIFSQFSIFPGQESNVSPNGQGTSSLAISIQPQPFIYGTDLYINTGNDIRSYSIKTGTSTHIYKIPNTGDPMVTNGILYTSGTNSTFAMRISDGKLLWQSPFGSENRAPPTVVNNILYGYTYKSTKTVYALKASDGRAIWQYHVTNQDAFLSPPIILQGNLYFTSYTPGSQSSGAHIYALNASSGSLLWQNSLDHMNASILQADGSTLYTVVDGYVEALQTSNGDVHWRYKLPSTAPSEISNISLKSVAKGIVFVSAEDGSIYALKSISGILLWQYQTRPGTLFGSFNAEGDAIYVSMLTTDNLRSSLIIAIQINTGHRLWQVQLARQEIAFPIIQQGIIYAVYASEGQIELFTLRAVDGHVLWHRTLYSLL
ncbi:PQQ-binding-like beta-propeller repeat protein [Dictyobacter arantiisoli]|uniref:Serine/threonine protein kinase n=1 Tax=Dictyobacter arantiisoli TaxID=2014874 RepID=A0A5A5TCE1_9CHLR|nr:PQQ-binding-like beta-propeller repeat protein [Dictyobacter arantiisoli]GCF09112.1 serine/threonine protein kinase [Dictyobacter arantiisoli]